MLNDEERKKNLKHFRNSQLGDDQFENWTLYMCDVEKPLLLKIYTSLHQSLVY